MACSLCHVLLVVLIHIRPQASLRTSSLDFGPESGYQITRWHIRVWVFEHWEGVALDRQLYCDAVKMNFSCILDENSCFSCLRKIHKLCICSLFVLCQTGCIRVLKWNFLTPKIIAQQYQRSMECQTGWIRVLSSFTANTYSTHLCAHWNFYPWDFDLWTECFSMKTIWAKTEF